MPRITPRLVLTFLLSLLLVGMQAEAQQHALEHLRPLLTRAHDVGAHGPVDDSACAECALLAGGADAVFGDSVSASAAVVAAERPRFALATRAIAAPQYFQSRAPPELL
jgi:hypothetical protein